MRYFADVILIIYESKETFCRMNVNVINESLVTQILGLGQIRFFEIVLFFGGLLFALKLLFFDLFLNVVIFYLSK